MQKQFIFSILFVFFAFGFSSCGKKNNTDKISENEANSETVEKTDTEKQKKLTQGCELKKEFFDQAEVFEPLAKDMPENQSPTKVSLEQYAPKRLSQGSQGSCTAWACTYAAMTINRARALQLDPNSIAFSPAFIYNQITKGNCTGTHIGKTLDKLTEEGVLSLAEFPYDDSDCSRQPNRNQLQNAEQFRMKGYNRLTLKDDDYRIDLAAIKQNIAQGAPVVIGMAVGGTFYQISTEGVWRPTKKDFEALKRGTDGHIVDDGEEAAFGGHAMCVIGYDDAYEGGAFQIMNSWGDDWGKDGIFWMSYKNFEFFCNSFYAEAYGLYPMESKKANPNVFKADIGLFQNKERQYIPFESVEGFTFATDKVMPKGVKFKIAVRNYDACYVYVIGQETDGTSYVLFPYTAKHSAYCGIVGTRLFPKDYSLQLDDIGQKDVMAVIFSKDELDYKTLNEKISKSKQKNYQDKIEDVLGEKLVKNVKFTDGQTIRFDAQKTEQQNIIAIVFEMQKK
jgi:C1A family cysteine protease